MEKLYYQVPYVKEFEAVVISCREKIHAVESPPHVRSAELESPPHVRSAELESPMEYEVVLDRTGFYPEGGGQPADTGIMGGVKVFDVHERQGEILHYTDAPIEPGTAVKCVIDWDRRYANMQQHSGEHLYSGLVHHHYGYDNVGFHMGSDGVTIDFNGPLTMEQAEVLEREANRLVYENLPVNQLYPTAEELHSLEYRSKKELTGQVRIVEIPGGDVCACCGTHVEKTGEIGIIKILGMMNHRGGVRMTMLCGMKALLDYEKKQSQVIRISKLLSAKQEEVGDAVERMKQDNADKDFLINGLYEQLFRLKSRELPEQDAPLLVFEEGLTPVWLRTFCTMLYEQKRGSVVLVCSGTEGRFQYALGSAGQDMRAASRELNHALNGRGGGSALLAQGTFLASRQEIERIFGERV